MFFLQRISVAREKLAQISSPLDHEYSASLSDHVSNIWNGPRRRRRRRRQRSAEFMVLTYVRLKRKMVDVPE